MCGFPEYDVLWIIFYAVGGELGRFYVKALRKAGRLAIRYTVTGSAVLMVEPHSNKKIIVGEGNGILKPFGVASNRSVEFCSCDPTFDRGRFHVRAHGGQAKQNGNEREKHGERGQNTFDEVKHLIPLPNPHVGPRYGLQTATAIVRPK